MKNLNSFIYERLKLSKDKRIKSNNYPLNYNDLVNNLLSENIKGFSSPKDFEKGKIYKPGDLVYKKPTEDLIDKKFSCGLYYFTNMEGYDFNPGPIIINISPTSWDDGSWISCGIHNYSDLSTYYMI